MGDRETQLDRAFQGPSHKKTMSKSLEVGEGNDHAISFVEETKG